MPDSKFRQKYPNLPCAVVITAIPDEFKAVRAYFEKIEEDKHPVDKTIYRCGIFSSNKCSWAVAIALIGAENSNAAVETKRAIDYFEPKVVLFVGVAGGLKDVKLGDVVAATKIYGYESGKVTEQGFRPRPDAPRVSYALEQRARIEATEDDWLQQIKERKPRRCPQAFVGPIASSNIVLASKDSDEYKRLISNYGDALAVEMEGHGFLTAVRANLEVNALVIRGISDLIDKKSEADKRRSQPTAARHASAFAFQILAKFEIDKSQLQQRQEEAKRRRGEINRLDAEIEQDEGNIAELHRQVQRAVPPQFIKALNWLAKRKEIAITTVGRALNESSELKQIIDKTDLPQITRKEFDWQIEKYLERIYYSLYNDSRDLLQEPGIPLSLPVTAYQTVLRLVK